MKEINYKDVSFFVKDRYYHDNLLNRFKNNSYEKDEESLIEKKYDKNDIVFEIGSCLGYITSLLSKKCKSVISVEANPELYEGLVEMKRVNNLDNVTYINGYVSNEEGTVEFQTYDNIVAGSGDREDLEINNVRGWGDTLVSYEVNKISLNDIEGMNEVNSMVIDCEGGELIFLTENLELIKKQINKITIELHQHLMKDNTFNAKCIQLINKAGLTQVEKMGNTYYFEKK